MDHYSIKYRMTSLLTTVIYLIFCVHMSELCSYCTVAFLTQNSLYLSIYTPNFDNFFEILVTVYSTYQETVKIFSYRDYIIFKKERLKLKLFEVSIAENGSLSNDF